MGEAIAPGAPLVGLTLRQILLPTATAETAADTVRERIGEAPLAEIAERVPPALAPIGRGQVGRAIGSLLAQNVFDLLATGWGKYRLLRDAARSTLSDPPSTEVVTLATHTITAGYSPRVDVLYQGARILEVPLGLRLRGEFDGVAAVVHDGSLVGVQGGACHFYAALTLQGREVASGNRSHAPLLEVGLTPPLTLAIRGAADA